MLHLIHGGHGSKILRGHTRVLCLLLQSVLSVSSLIHVISILTLACLLGSECEIFHWKGQGSRAMSANFNHTCLKRAQPTPFSRVRQPGQAHKPRHIHQGGQNSQNSTPDSVNMFHLSLHLSAYPAFSYRHFISYFVQYQRVIFRPVSEGDIAMAAKFSEAILEFCAYFYNLY